MSPTSKSPAAKKAPAKSAAPKPAAKPVAKAAPAKAAPAKKTGTKPPAPGGIAAPISRKVPDDKFLAKIQATLLAERAEKMDAAMALKAEADALTLDAEAGDTQFDEEGGEGGTLAIDRERDLALSAQQQSDVREIDTALDKIDAGTFGICERCGKPIPKARLEVLPWAALCVSCKSGGLSARR